MRLLLSCLLCSVAFALSTWQVLGSGPLVRWDEYLGVALRHASPSTVPAEALSDIGNMAVALPLLAAAMALRLLAGRGRGWWPVLCCALAMGAMAVIVSLVKVWTDRTGPLGGSGYFPSGHAATTTVALGGAVLLLSGLLSRPGRILAWAAAALLTAGNGLGLVWRGYHWPLDVAASWCLGALLLGAVAVVARPGHLPYGTPAAGDDRTDPEPEGAGRADTDPPGADGPDTEPQDGPRQT